MPSDDKKKKINQEQEFQAWDREHREPSSPASEEEVYVIPDAERERMRLEEALQRGVTGMFEALRNKARRKAYDAESAAIKAEFDGHEKDAGTIPHRSPELAPPADPKPRNTEIKPRAPVVEIAKPAKPAATSENHSTDTTPAPRIPADEIAEPADPEPSKADDEDSTIEERMRLWRKAEKGIDLSHAEARKMYQIGKTSLHERFNRTGSLTKGKRGFVTSASIKANPPGFIGRKDG
jgi:hypothetical protein